MSAPPPSPAFGPTAEAVEARLAEVNAELLQMQERARASARLLEDMSRSLGPDGLTQLPNRTLLLDRLTQAIATAHLHQTRLCVLAVDLADLPMIREQRGPAMADAVIRGAAARFREAVGTIETVSRHGDHTFLILLPEVLLLDDTENLAHRLADALSTPWEREGYLPSLRVSIGAAFYPDHGQAPLELIANAVAAMERATETGARTWQIFDGSLPRGRAPDHALLGGAPATASAEVPGLHESEPSVIQAYLCDANEQLLLASLRSMDDKEAAERALHRQTNFLALLAHELRTPLTPIALAAAMMSEVPQDQFPRLQGVIDRQIKHISRLLTDLMEVSRFSHGKVRLEREVIPIGAIIDQAADTCASAIAARQQRLKVVVPRQPLRVFGDTVRLAQVFTNILDNASKYTPVGGAINVRVRASAETIEVTIADTGIGIAQEVLPHIFESFMQDRRAVAFNGMGLGIGLAVVRQMVEAHGGHVAAFSEGAQRGTRFEVTLPRVSARDPRAAGAATGRRGPRA